MQQRGFRSVFVKLFASVMLALTLFAVAMVLLTQLVHDKDATIRSQVLATQILSQVDPFLDDLNQAVVHNNRLQARFMLAVIKKSFDIFDESLQAKMGLYDHEGHLLMQTNNSDLPSELPKRPSWTTRVFPFLSETPAQQVQVYSSTGYILLFESRLPPKKPIVSAALNLFSGTLLLLCIMAGVLWWIARSMTWRINQLSHQMVQLGEGDFSARVTVRGNDEIAVLGKGFNQAAQKIEHLVNANNLLLAHASHELRTPITRIRLQIEMMDMLAAELQAPTKAKFDKRAAAINRDLTGLNDLVESILLVSRLDAGHALQQVERLDLYELVNQERQHYPEASLIGEHIIIEGQPQLLTHLIRNLLNNAMLHGVPPVTVMLYGAESVAEASEIPEHLILSLLLSTVEDDNSSSIDTSESPLAITLQPNSSQAESSRTSSAKDTQQQSDQASTAQTQHTPVEHCEDALDLVKTTEPSDRNDSGQQSTANQDSPSAERLIKTASDNPNGVKDKAVENDPVIEATKEDSSTDFSAMLLARKESLFKKRARKVKPEEPPPPPNFAVLAVIDEGHGIPEDKRKDIFSPFVRLQQKKKGSGLGLSLVSQIVTAHQGRITTDTVNGHTRFLVILPVNATHSAIDIEEEHSS